MTHFESLDARRLYTTGLDAGFANAGQLSFPDSFQPDIYAERSVESGDKGSIFVSGKLANGNAAIAKYDDNGHLITRFGVNGFATVPFEVDHMAYDSARGMLYIAGNDTGGTTYPALGETPKSKRTEVARLGATGRLDASFGKSGIFEYRIPQPEGDFTFSSTSTETINLLNDGSVLLGVDRATRWRTGSADQDLVLIKLKPNGSFDTRFGTNGITQVINGYFEPSYAINSTRRARGYRGLFADVQVDTNGNTRVAINYGDGTRNYREDFPNVSFPIFGKFSVLSRTINARGKLDRSLSAAWEMADTARPNTGLTPNYIGFDGRALHAEADLSVDPTQRQSEAYLYTLRPGKRPARQLLLSLNDANNNATFQRSANGKYIMTDWESHLYRLNADFSTDRTFAVNGVGTGDTTFVLYESPRPYADDEGRALVFQYAGSSSRYVLNRFA